MRLRLANFISNVFNPFLLSLVAILLISISSTERLSTAFMWSLIVIGISMLPVYLLAIYFVKSGRLDSVFSSSRQQRSGIYVSGCISVLLSGIILYLLGAPTELVAIMITVLVTGVVFLIINLRWKISIHAAFAMGVSLLLVLLYGWVAIITLPLVLLIAWSRVELGQHSGRQVSVGALVAMVVLLLVFHFFELL